MESNRLKLATLMEKYDYPIKFIVGEGTYTGDYFFELASVSEVKVGEYLDIPDGNKHAITSREQLKEIIYGNYVRHKKGDETPEEYLRRKMGMCDKYWRKAILVYLDGCEKIV